MDAHFSAEEHFCRGEAELEGGRHTAALEHFRAAHRLDPTSARIRSFYGLCIGLAESRFDRALELCRTSAKEEFFNPVLYHNLARVHLAFGFKAEAIRYLRRGLMIDPASAPIRDGAGATRRPAPPRARLPAPAAPAESLVRPPAPARARQRAGRCAGSVSRLARSSLGERRLAELTSGAAVVICPALFEDPTRGCSWAA